MRAEMGLAHNKKKRGQGRRDRGQWENWVSTEIER